MLEQFPQALKESRRWVCFDAAKTPINPATGQNAKPNDPATWGTLEAAQAAVSRFGLRGVGVLLGLPRRLLFCRRSARVSSVIKLICSSVRPSTETTAAFSPQAR